MHDVNGPSLRGLKLDPKDDRLRSREKGAVSLKSVIWLAIMGSFIYVCFVAGPVFMTEYQFQDTMQNMARFASVNRQTAEELRSGLLKEAAKENIPLKAEDIKITASSGNVKIDAAYSVTVDLHFYQWTINFHPSATNNSLT